MFDGWIPDPMKHTFPDDGFPHRRDLDCMCHPQVIALPGIAAAVCHRKMEFPDTPPEDWK